MQTSALQAPGIVLITGIMAAGKTTIAQLVAERLPKSVHLRGDVFRRMIVNGRAEIEPDAADEAMAQLQLRYELAADSANLYCRAGFTVVYQDVIIGPMLADVVSLLTERPLYVVALCPSPDVVMQRETNRPKVGYAGSGWTPDALDKELRNNTPRVGLWVDSSALSSEETVDAIIERIEEARIR